MFKGIVTCTIYLSMEKEYGYKLVYTDWYHAQNVFVRMAAMQVGLGPCSCMCEEERGWYRDGLCIFGLQCF